MHRHRFYFFHCVPIKYGFNTFPPIPLSRQQVGDASRAASKAAFIVCQPAQRDPAFRTPLPVCCHGDGPARPSKNPLVERLWGGGGGRGEKNKTCHLPMAPTEPGQAGRRSSSYFISLMGNNNRCGFHHLSCGVITRRPSGDPGPPSGRLCCRAAKLIRPALAVSSLDAEPDDQRAHGGGALETVGSPESR